MRISYYGKLACKDLRERLDLYVPYTLMNALCFCFLYVIRYLSVHIDVRGLRMGATMTPVFLGAGSFLLGVLIFVLLWNFSMMLRRQNMKRQGLYRILGLTRKHLLILQLYEYAMLFFVSIVLGIVFCLVFGQLLFLIAGRFAQQTIVSGFGLDFSLVVGLLVYFLLLQGLLLLRDSLYICRHNPLRMLRKEKQQEEPKANLPAAVVGVLLLGYAYYLALTIQEMNTEQADLIVLATVLVIFATCFLYNGVGMLLLKLLQRCDRLYYHKKRLLSISGLLFRLRSYASSMSAITILLSMLIMTVSMCLSLYLGVEHTVRAQFPEYEYRVQTNIGEEELQTMAKKHGLAIKDSADVYIVHDAIMLVQKEQTLWIGKVMETLEEKDHTPAASVITLSGYNAVMGEQIELEDDEVLLYNNTPFPIDQLACRMQKENGEIETFPLRLKHTDKRFPFLEKDVMLIVPDNMGVAYQDYLFGEYSTREDRKLEDLEQYYVFETEGSEKDKIAFSKELNCFTEEHSDLPDEEIKYIDTTDYYTVYYDMISSFGSFLFLGILFSVIFLCSVFMILYYRSHEDMREQKKRFAILHHVGLTRREVWRTFVREQRWLILLPPFVAVLHCLVAYRGFHLFAGLFGFSESEFSFEILLGGCLFVIAVFVLYHSVMLKMMQKWRERT